MAIIKTYINPICFPHELKFLEVTTDTENEGVLIEIKVEGNPVYASTLYSDRRHIIELRGLDMVVASILEKNAGHVQFDLNGVTNKRTFCVPCQYQLTQNANKYFTQHFGTRADGPIITHPGKTEFLTLVELAGEYAAEHELVFTAHYLTPDDGWHRERWSYTREIPEYAYTESIVVDDIRAKYPNGQLVSFEVVDYDRYQKYLVVDADDEMVDVCYLNTFGFLEHLSLPYVESKTNSQFEKVRINGELVNYKRQPKRTFTATADVPVSMVGLYEDLMSSAEVLRMDTETRIVMESGEIGTCSSGHKSATAKITWMDAGNQPADKVREYLRTFDASFDYTFQ